MRINPKIFGAWLPGEATQAKRAKSPGEAAKSEARTLGEDKATTEAREAAPRPSSNEVRIEANVPDPALANEEYLSQAEAFSEDLAQRLKNASGKEVASTIRDLKLREAALRQTLRANEALLPSSLIEFLH